jgi:sulfate permease, SulP family
MPGSAETLLRQPLDAPGLGATTTPTHSPSVSDHRGGSSAVNLLIREVSGGLFAGLLTVVYSFSYAAILFSGPIAHGFAVGLSMALITAVVAAVAIALLGNVKFAIAGPDIYSAAPLAAMLSALASLLPQAGAQPQSLATLLLALTLATLLTGAIFYVVGALHYANVIRHVPYPVIAGFLSGTGALITLAGVGIVTDTPASVANVAALMEPAQVQKLVVAFGFALLCALAVRRFKQAITLPALIVLGIVGFYLGLRLAGLDLGAARAHGWLFDLDAASYGWRPWYLETAGTLDWRLYLDVLPEMLAVCVITMLAVLINASSLEVLVEQECDLNRDLRAHGIACATSAGLGGFVGSLSISRTALNRLGGGRGRLSVLVCAAFAGAILLFGANVISAVPRFVLGALMINLGLQFVWKWSFGIRHTLSRVDQATILAILAAVVAYGYGTAIALGTVVSAIIFATHYARVPVCRCIATLAQQRSLVERSLVDSRRLGDSGERVRIMYLQGFLFFGSAYKLQRQASQLLLGARALILDFQMVESLDSSACYSLLKLVQLAKRQDVTLVMTRLNEKTRKGLDMGGVCQAQHAVETFDSLDDALSRWEERLLREDAKRQETQPSFRDWLASFLNADDVVDQLLDVLQRRELSPGESLCEQGSPANFLYFVDQGRLQAIYRDNANQERCVRVMVERTLVGEMGFFADTTRSVSLRAQTLCAVFGLERRDYRHLCAQHPQLSEALLESVVRVLIERLNASTELIFSQAN